MKDQQLLTSICCIDRLDLYNTEKPFEVVFKTSGDFPRTNMSTSRHHDIPVHDMRGNEDSFSLSKNGFCIMNLETSMESADFEDETAIRSIYLPLVAKSLKARLGASRVQVHDYMVRRSHPDFPISTGKPYTYEQPAMLLHIDTSPAGTVDIIKATARDDVPDLLNMRYQYVTVWKPIRGPVKRWPLMIVDNSTVDAKNDLRKRDMVYPDSVMETLVAHNSDSYKFYYLSEQKTNEALVILQTDSAGVPGCPHTSFPTPNVSDSDPQRESIEVRTLVYYE